MQNISSPGPTRVDRPRGERGAASWRKRAFVGAALALVLLAAIGDGVLLLAGVYKGGTTKLRRVSVALASGGAGLPFPAFNLRSREVRQRSSRARVWCGLWRRRNNMIFVLKSI